MFILDKNINHDQTVPTSLLFPGSDEELPNDVYVFPSFIQKKHKSKLISKKMSMFFQNKLKTKLNHKKVFP